MSPDILIYLLKYIFFQWNDLKLLEGYNLWFWECTAHNVLLASFQMKTITV